MDSLQTITHAQRNNVLRVPPSRRGAFGAPKFKQKLLVLQQLRESGTRPVTAAGGHQPPNSRRLSAAAKEFLLCDAFIVAAASAD